MQYLRFVLLHTARSLRRSGRRTLVAVLCITVGVAAVVALQIAAATVSSALTSNVRSNNGGDVSLSSQASPLSAADLQAFDALRRGGDVQAWTAVARIHATAAVAAGTLVPFEVNTVDLTTYPLAGDPTLVTPAGGSVRALLQARGDALMSSVLADELGAGVGSSLRVHGIGGPGLTVTVRGILAATTLEHSAVLEVARSDAAALSDAAPQYVSVLLLTGDGAAVAAHLRSGFPQATVSTVDEAVQSAQQQVHDFREFSLLTGLVTLLVAGVGIFNTMHSMLASRSLEIAMLKAIGFGPRAMFMLLAVEAAAIGVCGGVVGTLLGLAASALITGAVSSAAAISAPLVIEPSAILLGVTLGAAATVLFALVPLVRAAQLRPLTMLRPAGDVPVRAGALATAVLVLLSAALFALLAGVIVGDLTAGLWLVGLAGGLTVVFGAVFAGATAAVARLPRPHSSALRVLVFGALLVLTAGTALVLPAVAAVVALVAALWALRTLAPAEVRVRVGMATRALDRRRLRTAVTLVALLVGVFSMTLTITVSATLHDQLATALASTGATNLVAVSSPAGRDGLLHNVSQLAGLQSYTVATTVTARPVTINGRPVSAPDGGGDPEDNPLREVAGVSGYELRSGAHPVGLVAEQGRLLTPADAGTFNIVVPSRLSESPLSLRPGATLTVVGATPARRVTLTVVGTYGTTAAAGGRRSLTRLYGPSIYGDVAVAAALDPGNAQTLVAVSVDAAQLVHDSVTLQRGSAGALVVNVNDLTAVVRQVLDNLVTVLAVIAALSLLAGLTVVANGVTLAMLERRHEIAVMKALGYPPRTVTQLVMMENAIGGLIAGSVSVIVVAVSLAALSHWVFTTPIAFSAGIALLVLVVAALLAVSGAWLGSRRAVVQRPTEVLRNT